MHVFYIISMVCHAVFICLCFRLFMCVLRWGSKTNIFRAHACKREQTMDQQNVQHYVQMAQQLYGIDTNAKNGREWKNDRRKWRINNKKRNKLTIEHSVCCRHDIVSDWGDALSCMANCKESKKILKLIYVWKHWSKNKHCNGKTNTASVPRIYIGQRRKKWQSLAYFL